MSRVFLAGLLALPLLLSTGGKAEAQWAGPNLSCVNCVNFFSKIHQHGPLFNYGPYSGYYPFEPYGPWTSDLRYNPPAQNCGHGGCGRQGLFANWTWGQYAHATWDNVRKRLHPSSIRCGTGGCGSQSGCSTCGSAAAAPTTGCAGCSAKIDIPVPAVVALK